MTEATKLEEYKGQILRRQEGSKREEEGEKEGNNRKIRGPVNENAERRVKLRSWRRRRKDILTRLVTYQGESDGWENEGRE
jgi:hypothetical protein